MVLADSGKCLNQLTDVVRLFQQVEAAVSMKRHLAKVYPS